MKKLSVLEKFGYGLGDTASNIVFQVVMTFMMFFYTEVYGLSAAAVGTMFIVVRIFDAVTDPMMGGLADRTNTKWGSYRPYLVWFAIPYGIIAVFAFTTPDFGETGKLVYAYITYILLMSMYTAINIPYSALGGVITSDPNERASVQSWRFALAMFGGFIVTLTLLKMVEYFGQGDQQAGFSYAMMVLSVFAVICFIGCFALTKERIKVPHAKASSNITGVLKDVQKMLENDQWRIIGIITLLILISVVMRGSTPAYYAQYYLQGTSAFWLRDLSNTELITLFTTGGMVAGILGALCANFLVSKMCKVRLMKMTAISIVVFNGALFFVPREAIEIAFILTFLANFVHMIFTPLLFSAVPDTVDYGIKKLGQSAMAMAVSGHLFMLKLGIAIGGAASAYILGFSGYESDVEQSESALNGILFLYSISSVIAGVAIYILLRQYKLTRDFKEA